MILNNIFICFAAKDRYDIVEPIVYQLKNYGIDLWYDRFNLLMGDNRKQKNLDEGVRRCKYAIAILSTHTVDSVCAMEELSIIESRSLKGEITVFPVLYKISPHDIPFKLHWITKYIFKEVKSCLEIQEICNHIACKITDDFLCNCCYNNIQDIVINNPFDLPSAVNKLLHSYQEMDYANLNSRVSLLYATYIVLIHTKIIQQNIMTTMIKKIFERLFSELRLNLEIDYRDLWLLENSICILIDTYLKT